MNFFSVIRLGFESFSTHAHSGEGSFPEYRTIGLFINAKKLSEEAKPCQPARAREVGGGTGNPSPGGLPAKFLPDGNLCLPGLEFRSGKEGVSPDYGTALQRLR